MTYLDNPAGRLLATIDRARGVRQEQTAREGWCEVFELAHPEEEWRLPSHFGDLASLAMETRTLVESLHDDDPEVVLEHFGEVESLLGLTLHLSNNNMGWSLSPLKPTGTHCLKTCSSLLHRRLPEPTLDPRSVGDLRSQVSSLFEEVRRADDLDSATRRAVLDKLDEIYEALRRVETLGARPVRHAADSLIGSMLLRAGTWRAVGRSKVGVSLYALLTSLDLLFNLGANYQALTQADQGEQPSPAIIQVWTVATGEDPPALPAPQAEVVVEPAD